MIRSRYSTHYYLAFHEIDSPSEDEKFYEAAGSFCASTALGALKIRTFVR
ncbi:Hypothetical protein ERS075554_04076 [Mycobacteroides abscessus]|nr:Hypothetical protein ERS075505_00037 [Mycobacteroides abscessus]CPS53439.1 Hypothetical protein ERS075504_04855 [Mycobacteroides abscessus]CPS56604.1 Hypothetical protein ERS075506_04623 [Mycobacteroides abscessus]CPT27448.1 Hypothetical protein ERS075524_02978 [Mycobacteroides abscessus]CPT41069.1 Hypothetical protein ERS075529_02304 [Mycobacteroides abscessus]